MTVQNVPQKTECFPQAHHKTIRSLTKYCKKIYELFWCVVTNYWYSRIILGKEILIKERK